MNFKLDVAIRRRICNTCGESIKPKTVHIIQYIWEGAFKNKLNHCKKCSLKFLNKQQDEIQDIIEQLNQNVLGVKYVTPPNIIAGVL